MNQNKICRLPWNGYEPSWSYPSGPMGKSRGKSWERENGFAEEEWLFRREFQHDGFQYGYLEPVHKAGVNLKGKSLNLKFYTIDGDTGKRYWVASIDDVHVLNDDRLSEIRLVRAEQHWREIQIEEAKLEGHPTRKTLREMESEDWFLPNVRFLADSLLAVLPITLKEIPDFQKYISTHRYRLLKPLRVYVPEAPRTGFDFESGRPDVIPPWQPGQYRQVPRVPKEPSNSHHRLMEAFHIYLRQKYPQNRVRRECPSSENRVDLVLEEPDGFVFFELKTYESVRTSLRVALGQLTEYALFPSTQYAKKIVLVTDRPPDERTATYIHTLKSKLTIPFGFIEFDPDSACVLMEL